MTIGFIYDGGSAYITPDKTMSRKSAPKVLLANFGDGYEQRVADGINTVKETYTLSFRNRPKTLIDDVVTFLDTKAGVTKFPLVLPDNTTTVQVVCDSYDTNYEQDDFYSLNLNVRRVFEA